MISAPRGKKAFGDVGTGDPVSCLELVQDGVVLWMPWQVSCLPALRAPSALHLKESFPGHHPGAAGIGTTLD